MGARTAFVLGVFVGKTLMDISGAIATSDTPLGKEVRNKLYARRDFDRLVRTEAEIGEEITRRIRKGWQSEQERKSRRPAWMDA